MLDVNFWQDKLKSQKIIKEKKLYGELVNSYNESIKSLEDLDQLNELAIEEKNINIQNEILGNIKNLRESVKIAKKYYETEASGNVTLKTVKAIASTGVNRISVGSITHSAPAIDFKLEI